MSTTRFPWALGSICTSGLLLAAAALAAQPAAPATATATAQTLAQLELALARQEQLYLLIDPPRGVVEIRARGMALDRVPLTGFALLGFHPLRGAGAGEAVSLPGRWTVVEEAAAPHRKLIAPSDLTPFPKDGDESESSQPSPAAAEELAPPPPSAYRVGLDGGWALELAQTLPAEGFWARWNQALNHGWQNLRGHPPATPNLVALALDVESARRLHHLLLPGTTLLVAPGAFAPPAVETADEH